MNPKAEQHQPDMLGQETLVQVGQTNQAQSQKGSTQRAVHHYLENLNGHEAATTDLYDLVIAETEKGMIIEVLDWCGGNQSRAAALLGITRTTLRNKIRKLGI